MMLGKFSFFIIVFACKLNTQKKLQYLPISKNIIQNYISQEHYLFLYFYTEFFASSIYFCNERFAKEC